MPGQKLIYTVYVVGFPGLTDELKSLELSSKIIKPMAKYTSFKELDYEEEIGLNNPMRNARMLLNHLRYFSKLADDLPEG